MGQSHPSARSICDDFHKQVFEDDYDKQIKLLAELQSLHCDC